MLMFLLKFTACLSILLIFYKLLLEKENFHVFKRVYLMMSILVSLIIPCITFTYYIEPSEALVNNNINPLITTEASELQFSELMIYIILSIYCVGVIVFGFKFIKNLYLLLFRIKNNKKVKVEAYTNVLLKEPIVPHTFFSYIFFNKNKFEQQEIPEEVILHEKTHAIQKHSIDILFIEFIQVLFWFHPLLYLYNKSIKLNHEFLADQAVLKSGISTPNYQNILLAFSSNANYSPLANAINYSFIKKRFTVMKTQTSKKSFWLKSLLLLPLFSLLLFSFSSIEEIEREDTLIENISDQEGATKKQIREYNKLARKYNTQEKDNIIVRKKEVERLNYLFNLMTKEQKYAVEPFPYFPPPPPHDKIIKGINDEGENVLPPPPPPAPKVIKGVNDKNTNIPPPPPPAPDTKKVKKKVKELKKKEKSLALKNDQLIKRQEVLKEKRIALNDTRRKELKNKLVEERKEFLLKRELVLKERKKQIESRRKEVEKKRELRKEELRNN